MDKGFEMNLWQKLSRKKFSVALLVTVLAILILPSDPVTDVLVTLPLLACLGVEKFLLLCAGVILAWIVFANGKR